MATVQDEIDALKKQLDTLQKAVDASKVDDGTEGSFLAKGKTNITSKSILTKMFFARTDEDIQHHKNLLNSPIYDIRDGKMYVFPKMIGQKWLQIDNAMKEPKYLNAFIFDTSNNTLFFNDGGNLQEIITTMVVTDSFKIPGNGDFRVPLSHPLTRDVKVLVKDNTNKERGPLMVAAEGLCTVAYDNDGVDIFNETDNAVDIEISYKADLGSEFFVNAKDVH